MAHRVQKNAWKHARTDERGKCTYWTLGSIRHHAKTKLLARPFISFSLCEHHVVCVMHFDHERWNAITHRRIEARIIDRRHAYTVVKDARVRIRTLSTQQQRAVPSENGDCVSKALSELTLVGGALFLRLSTALPATMRALPLSRGLRHSAYCWILFSFLAIAAKVSPCYSCYSVSTFWRRAQNIDSKIKFVDDISVNDSRARGSFLRCHENWLEFTALALLFIGHGTRYYNATLAWRNLGTPQW